MKEKEILEKVGKIPAGFGRIFCVRDGECTLTTYGDMCEINAKEEGMNILDTYMDGANNIFGGKILAIYRESESEKITIQEFSGEAIFSGIN